MTIKTKALSLPDASIIAGIVLLISFLIIIISMPSLTIGTLKHWDREAMLMLNGSQGAWMDQFWYAFSSFKTWIVAMVFIAITIWNTCKGTTRQKLLFMLCFVLLFVMLDQISSSLIKPWVARLRPSHAPVIGPLLHYVSHRPVAPLCQWISWWTLRIRQRACHQHHRTGHLALPHLQTTHGTPLFYPLRTLPLLFTHLSRCPLPR